MRKLGISRDELFAEIDRPALKALPATPYQFAEWKKCRAAPDYHVEIADHYYSVPSRLIREQLEARITDTTIEFLHKGVRVASRPVLMRAVGTQRFPSTCRARTGATPSGRRPG
jgi:transposase